MKVVEFLRNGGTMQQLSEQFCLEHRTHLKYPNLVSLKYDKIDSPFEEQIVRECRGLVLDSDDNWKVRSRSFDKFFNVGEGMFTGLDWSKTTVLKKLDGSLITVYFYKDELHFATTGTPDSRGVTPFGSSFKELVEKAIRRQKIKFNDQSSCYFFELTAPDNRVVVPYTDTTLTLLGWRKFDESEFGIEAVPELALSEKRLEGDIQLAEVFNLNNVEEMFETFSGLNPLYNEGYVAVCYELVGDSFQRGKIKHPGYVALHHNISSASPKNLLKLVMSGESSEWLSYFKHCKNLADEISRRIDVLSTKAEVSFLKVQHIDDMKKFALSVSDNPLKHALFAMKRGQAKSAKQYLCNLHVDSLARMINLEDFKNLKPTEE